MAPNDAVTLVELLPCGAIANARGSVAAVQLICVPASAPDHEIVDAAPTEPMAMTSVAAFEALMPTETDDALVAVAVVTTGVVVSDAEKAHA